MYNTNKKTFQMKPSRTRIQWRFAQPQIHLSVIGLQSRDGRCDHKFYHIFVLCILDRNEALIHFSFQSYSSDKTEKTST